MKKLGALLVLLAVISSTGCTDFSTVNATVNAENPPNMPATETMQEAVEEKPVYPAVEEELVITAVGDIMMHNTQLNAGHLYAGEYDFSSFFVHVKPLLSASDLVIGNLETTFAGESAGYSGYPRFNTPETLGLNLKDAGFHVLTTANNHCLDQGPNGLISTLDYLDRISIMHTGTARSQEEQDSILLVERKGINMAILAYTFSTNGIPPAADQPYSVNFLDTDRIIADIKKARSVGADITIVALHNGVEYQNRPNASQRQLVDTLLKEGADVILGHHPHVLQPTYVITADNSPFGNKFAIYSLGNFISDQKGMERLSSIILNLHFAVDPESRKPYFKKAAYIPIRTRRFWENGKTSFEVLPIEAALTSYRMGRLYYNNNDKTGLEDSFRHITKTLQTNSPFVELQPLQLPLDQLDLIKVWK